MLENRDVASRLGRSRAPSNAICRTDGHESCYRLGSTGPGVWRRTWPVVVWLRRFTSDQKRDSASGVGGSGKTSVSTIVAPGWRRRTIRRAASAEGAKRLITIFFIVDNDPETRQSFAKARGCGATVAPAPQLSQPIEATYANNFGHQSLLPRSTAVATTAVIVV